MLKKKKCVRDGQHINFDIGSLSFYPSSGNSVSYPDVFTDPRSGPFVLSSS